MPFALPMISSASEVSRLKVPELSTSSLAYLFDMADELKRRGGDEAIMRIIDIQTPIDIAALIWNKNDFYVATVEAPEAVAELADKTRQLLVAFVDEWFSRYGREFIAHCPIYYMPYGLTLSEDEVGAVSTAVFNELFLPQLEALSEHYGALGIHCCANSQHQWGGFLKIPNLRLLNLTQPAHVIRDAYPFFASKTVQMHYETGLPAAGPAQVWPLDMPNTRLSLEIPAQTRDEALALSEKYWAAREEQKRGAGTAA